MEEPTFTAIDYNSKENRVIEERVRNYYLPVKNVLETVRDRRINIPNSPRGLCVDLIEVSRTINIEFNLSNDGTYLWQEVIKPWFTPQRFGLTHVYFGYSHHIIESIKDDTLDVNGGIYFRVPMKRLKEYKYLFHTAFWFPVSKDYNAERIKILECALEDLERIKREGEPELPPLTFEEPKIPMMEDLAKLTQEEKEILMLTEEIWNRFLALPINHPMEANEMAMKIHDIQRMIIFRPGFRLNQEIFKGYGKGNSDKG